ncbi:MAG: SdpI family protein [Gordonia sp. (in: high G+C Gram-positive bacteria)]
MRLGRRLRVVYAVSVVVAVILYAVATVWLAVGVAGLIGKLPRNRWLGVRADETMASDEAFELAHRVASPGFLGAAFVLIFGGTLTLTNSWGLLFALGTVVIALAILSLMSGIAIRAAATVPVPEDESAGCSSGCCSGGDDAQPGADADSCATDTDTCGTGDDPAADCGTSSCGSCALSGMCTPETSDDQTVPATP